MFGQKKEGEDDRKKKIVEMISGVFSKKEESSNEENKQELAKKVLDNVGEKYALKLDNGKIINNLSELADFLKTINKEIFDKYVDKSKNDFSLWVSNAVGDKALGDKLSKLNDPLEMSKIVEARIKELKPYLKKSSGEGDDKSGKDSKKDISGNNSSEEPAKGENAKGETKDDKTKKKKPLKKGDNKKQKSVAELLEEEGVVATEEESSEDEEKKSSEGDVSELFMAIEKIEGKLELFDQFRKSSDERIGDLAERIGELRQMLLDKERDFNEIESGFEKINEIVGEIKPDEIKKTIEKSQQELEKRDVKIEKLENMVAMLTKEVSDYRDRMSKIKNFETLMDSLNNIKKEVEKINEAKKYAERLSAKSEQIFADLNEKVSMFRSQLAKVEKIDELTQELLIGVDEIKNKQDKFVSKDDLEKFKEQMQKLNFGTTKAEFDKAIKELEKELVKVNDKLALMEYRTKSVSDLMDEKIRIKSLIDKVNRDYKDHTISEKAYLDSIKNAKKRLNEIEDTLKRLDRETLYSELNKITKIVNDHIVKFKKVVFIDEFNKLNKVVADLHHRLETSNIEKSIENLEEAKTNIFERLANAEKNIHDLDLKFKKIKDNLSDLDNLRLAHKEFEQLIAGNLSEIDEIKAVLSGMENKIEGEIRDKIIKIESSFNNQQHEINQKLKLTKEEIDLAVKDKLKMIDNFAEEIKALKDGKSLMFDKINSAEKRVDEINGVLNSLKGELRTIGPKLSSLENKIEGAISPELYSVRSKLNELESLKSDLQELKIKVEKLITTSSALKLESLSKQIQQIKEDLYGGGIEDG